MSPFSPTAITAGITGVTGASMRPAVTFSPVWNKILHGDSVTMICDVEGNVTWYRNYKWLHTGKTFTIQSARSWHSAYYQCGTSEEDISEAVTLNVTWGPLVLQSPPYRHEGDDLLLRCHSGSKEYRGPIKFYRNDELIHSSANDSEIQLRNEREKMAVYRCTKQVLTAGYSIYSDETDIRAQGAAPIRMTFYPNWRKILTGGNIRMMCGGDSGPYYWYKDNTFLKDNKKFDIRSAQRSDSGTYQCGTSSGLSTGVRLDVSDGPVILQAPLRVSGVLHLRCHSRPEYSVDWTRFYKGDKLLQDSGDVLFLTQAQVAGRYRCEKRLYRDPVSYSESVSVPIRDLFSSPEITLTQSETTESDNLTQPVAMEGDSLTLTCDTRLSPHTHPTELHFAFYRDGQEVLGFGPSNKYGVLSAGLEDSGNYSCMARTLDNRVRKTSQNFLVQIHEANRRGHDTYWYLVLLLIAIVSAIMIFRHRHHILTLFNKKNQTRDPHQVSTSAINTSAVETIYMEVKLSQEDLTENDDVCYTTLGFPAKASSPQRVTETVYSEVRMWGRDF
ncbi:uncharacterized protein [Dendropsophus ebraccatus]|uniref:uncharacterized protein n=1 Tax=Dendropsophus ebraccatus TaxID=150705 RepID=UPI0038320C5B